MAHKMTTNRKVTPQTEQIPGEAQVKNNAGGFVYKLDDMKTFERFLILGSGSTYYVNGKTQLKEHNALIAKVLNKTYKEAIDKIVAISDGGRAPKNDYAIYALAVALSHSNNDVKTYARQAVSKVCRIGTHLFTLTQYLDDMRGWGRSIRKAVGSWYENMDPEKLAYQLVKYQGRTVYEGSNNKWTHKDVLRLAHPKATTDQHAKLMAWAVKREKFEDFKIINAYEEMMSGNLTEKQMVALIKETNLPYVLP